MVDKKPSLAAVVLCSLFDFSRHFLKSYHDLHAIHKIFIYAASFHGKRVGRLVAIGPVNMPVTRLFVEEIILECRKNHITKVDILGFEFEMGLFPNVLDEARGKGIDITPKYIPADVFDKRAVDFDFESKREIIRVQNIETGESEEQWTGDYVFENEWQSFRTKKDRSLELTSIACECAPGRRKVAVKVVDIFGNDTMTIVEVNV